MAVSGRIKCLKLVVSGRKIMHSFGDQWGKKCHSGWKEEALVFSGEGGGTCLLCGGGGERWRTGSLRWRGRTLVLYEGRGKTGKGLDVSYFSFSF